ncbi:MAG: DMT family transporter [Myxococcota bacterium]
MSRDRFPLVGTLALGLTVIGFSMTGIWVRWLIALDPLAVTAGRVGVALLVLAPASWWLEPDRAAAWQALTSLRVHGLALCMTVFFTVAVASFQLAPVSLVVLMVGLAPAWVLIFQRIAGQSLDGRRVLGVGFALFGAAIALLPSIRGATTGDEGAYGVAMGALGGLVAGFFNACFVYGRSRLAERGVRPGAFLLAAMTSFWGLGLFLVAPFTQLGALAPRTSFEVGSMLALGVISTAAPLWGLGTSSRLLPPVVVAFVGPVLPFTAAVAAWVLLGEVPPLAFALGAPFVVAGIALVVWPRTVTIRESRSTSSAIDRRKRTRWMSGLGDR